MSDSVDHPAHYQFGKFETWDVVEAVCRTMRDCESAYHTGSILKYMTRWPRKGGVRDLKKARAHLDRLILRAKSLESARAATSEAQRLGLYNAPLYDPDGVAFRHGDVARMAELGVSDVCRACGIGDVPHESAASMSLGHVGIMDADGIGDYGNPTAPGCATPWDGV